MFTSCQKASKPPSEKEVKEALIQRINSQIRFDNQPIPPYYSGFSPLIKRITVLQIDKKKNSRIFFTANVLLEAEDYQFSTPRGEFIDSIQLELSKRDTVWFVRQMQHHVKYIKSLDTSNRHF